MGPHVQLEAYPKSVNPVPATNANDAVNVLPRKDSACLSTSSSQSPGSGLLCPTRDFSFVSGSTFNAAMRRAAYSEGGKYPGRVGPIFSQPAVLLDMIV